MGKFFIIICGQKGYGDFVKNTPDFDFTTGEFRLNGGDIAVLKGIDALRLWVHKTIITQLNRYSIYNGKAYGANIEDLIIGRTYGFDFVESELRRELETALLRHENIESLSAFSAVKKGTTLEVSFTLSTAYGKISEVYAYDL